MGREPCPLCIFQRFDVVPLASALIALIHNPATLGQTIYSGLGISACLVTIGIAARQLWLQAYPRSSACGRALITDGRVSPHGRVANGPCR